MSEAKQAPHAKRGRPRDETIDARVLDTTRELLATTGFAATTVQAIATASGVPSSAIYRRWTSRIELIEDAVAPVVPDLGPPTGDLRGDLTRFDDALRVAFTSPAVRAALPSLLGAYQSGHTARPPEAWWRDSWRPVFYDLLQAAGPDAIDPSVDRDDVFDLMLGSILVQTFIPTGAVRTRPAEQTVTLICRLVERR